jgi:hypothetical protein
MTEFDCLVENNLKTVITQAPSGPLKGLCPQHNSAGAEKSQRCHDEE